jgi:hypothetical protein
VINVDRYSCKVSVFCLILTKIRMFRQILVKSSDMKFHKNQLSGSRPDAFTKTGRNG